MISEYKEDDGMDPGLGEMSYDGAEYEMDEFGERIGSEDDIYEDTAVEEDEPQLESADDGTAMQHGKIEDGFAESLKPEQNPHLEDQIEDKDLHKEASADYDAEAGMPGAASEEDRPLL